MRRILAWIGALLLEPPRLPQGEVSAICDGHMTARRLRRKAPRRNRKALKRSLS